jgi:L-arabinose isomerase
MDFPYTDADNPAVAYGRFRKGKAVFVNLAPAADNSYTFIVSRIEMLGIDGEDKMKNSIHGWFRPNRSVADFLKEYSLAGGTHHAALVYGDVFNEMLKLGNAMDWKVVCI